jgi:hypothetical protein
LIGFWVMWRLENMVVCGEARFGWERHDSQDTLLIAVSLFEAVCSFLLQSDYCYPLLSRKHLYRQ